MMKRILSFMLAAFLLSSVFNLVSSAASTWEITFDLETADDKHEIVLAAGETVDVYFSIKRTDNYDGTYVPGALEARVVYDNYFVECVGYQKLLNGVLQPARKTATGEYCFVATYNPLFDGYEFYTSDMDFFKITLKVREGVSGVSYVKFDYNPDDLGGSLLSFDDINLERVPLNYNNFKIIVGEPTTVSFDVDGSITEKETYKGMKLGEVKPDTLSIPAGYKFDCWTLDGNMVDDSYSIVGDEQFVAKLVPDYTVEVYRDYMTGYYLVLVNGSAAGYEIALPSENNYTTYSTAHYNKDAEDNYRAAVISNKALVDSGVLESESEEFTKGMASELVVISDDSSTPVNINIAGIDGYYVNAVDIFDATAVQGVLEVSSVITGRADFVQFALKADVDASKKIEPEDVTAITGHADFDPAPRI